jgi:signal recognition particle receptor subunit beta
VVFFNYTTMQVTAKIVYYGPGLCGKTTNLQFIHQKTANRSRGEMVSLETETDRTLFFDLLPLDVGVIGGLKVRLQLYTVPGQVFYNVTRKLVLKGVDGIVFVADSQVAMLDANIESLRNLEANLAELNLSREQVPLVFQYNKRDIRQIQPVEVLNRVLNPSGVPYYEAAALHGIGVFETLKGVSKLALTAVRRKVQGDEARRKGPEARADKPEPAPPAPAAAAQRGAPQADPLAELVPETPEETTVEFAAGEDTDKIKPVETKGQSDITDLLEKLRTAALGPAPKPSSGPARDVEKRLQDLLVSDRDSRLEVKRKATLEVPARLLKESTTLKVQLAFDSAGGADQLDAVQVKFVGNRRLERLVLHLELELRGKA